MKNILLTLGLCTLFGTAYAHVEVKDAWARATTQSQKTSAAYATIYNHGETDQKIVSAFSPVAERTELHTHKMDDHGRMVMTQVDHMLLPAFEEVRLQPGGLHIMLINLHEPLVVGLDIPVTITFADGTTLTFRAKVQPLSHRPAGMQNHGNMNHH